MANAFNQKDFDAYVDYLLPSQYGDDIKNKTSFAGMFKNSTANQQGQLLIKDIIKLKRTGEQTQVVFQTEFLHSIGFIAGVSDDDGKHWLFTQPLSQGVQFDFLLKMIPTLDVSFAALIDPKYGKRITFDVGSKVVFSFTDIYGNSFSTEQLKGKVIVLNFWSLTCGPCIKEMPQLNDLVAQLKDKNVVFLALAFFSPKDMIINNFLPDHPFSYNIIEVTDTDNYVMNEFPTHIIVDKELKIKTKLVGASEENLRKLEAGIKGLL
jgi:thiol-disulfide isomerase/thioredoxin